MSRVPRRSLGVVVQPLVRAGATWPGRLLDTFVAGPGLPPRRAGGRACCRGGLSAGPSKSESPEGGRREGPRLPCEGRTRVPGPPSAPERWTPGVPRTFAAPFSRGSRHLRGPGEGIAMEPGGRGENFRRMRPQSLLERKKGERLPSGWGRLWKEKHRVLSVRRQPFPTGWSHVGVLRGSPLLYHPVGL